jgi:syntaxin-binding protein 1
MLKLMLDEIVKGTLDQSTFPYLKPPLDNSEELAAQSQASLRSAKPTWARNRTSTVESRQRIIIFMAGGATYSESRACYEVSKSNNRDIFLTTTHMLTPAMFVRQVGDLSVDRRRLDLPIDRPKQKAPSHLFASNDPRPAAALPGRGPPGRNPLSPSAPAPPQKSPRYDGRVNPYDQPPTAGLAALSMNSGTRPGPIPLNGAGVNGGSGFGEGVSSSKGKLEKKSKHMKTDSDAGEKKKRGFFGSKK